MESSANKPFLFSEKGFTLIEALVAMGIFSIVMLATATMLFTGISASASGNSRSMAGSVAQGWADDLMKRPYANVVTNTDIPMKMIDGRTFDTDIVVTNVSATLRHFEVSTTWRDKAGGHTVTITGLRTL